MKAAATALLMVAVSAPAMVPATTFAQDHEHRDRNWNGDRDSDWDPSEHYEDGQYDERTMSENDRVYRGKDGRYYCKRNDGSTGLVIGGLAGGVLGNVIGGGLLGTVLGAGGGALLGRNIDKDKNEVKCK